MRRYLPNNWHVATWVAVAAWVIWALWCNVPQSIDAPSDYARLSAGYTSVTGKLVDPQFVRFHRAVGFPVSYRWHQIMPNLTARLDFHSTWWLCLDVVLCVIATASVVYVLQSIRQFSVLHMLSATALIAFAIAFYQDSLPILLQAIFSLSPKLHFIAHAPGWYIPLFYFLPLPIALLFAWRKSTAGEPRVEGEIANSPCGVDNNPRDPR